MHCNCLRVSHVVDSQTLTTRLKDLKEFTFIQNIDTCKQTLGKWRKRKAT